MVKDLIPGRWVQVLGTFDFWVGQGAITSVQPAKIALKETQGGHDRVHLKGYSGDGRELFDETANPMYNSCEPREDTGTFEEFLPLTDDLLEIRLLIDGKEVAKFTRGRSADTAGIKFGAASTLKPHRIPIASETVEVENVTYTIQARPNGDPQWQTTGIGLPTIEAGELDVNQFPGAERIEVRILQSDGFTEREIHREMLSF